MGFFDFIGKAVQGIVGEIKHSSIVQSLGGIAGVISHAVPTVGPLIEGGVSALQAVFSNNTPQAAPGQPPPPAPDPYSSPVIINLQQDVSDVKAMVSAVNKDLVKLGQQFQEEVKSLSAELKEGFQQVLKYHNDLDLITLQGQVSGCIDYFLNTADDMAAVTANSSESSFIILFEGEGGSATLHNQRVDLQKAINQIKARLEAPSYHPSQQIIDLYLLAIHWLLVFDKAIIVTKGLQARSYWTSNNYRKYLEAIHQLGSYINGLRAATRDAVETIDGYTERVKKMRMESITAKADLVNKNVAIDDVWASFATGWILPDEKTKLLGDNASHSISDLWETSTPDAAKIKEAEEAFKESIAMKLYKAACTEKLDVHLAPSLAVRDNLLERVVEWNARVPVVPATPREPNLFSHVSAKVMKEGPDAQSNAIKELLLRGAKHLQYSITYVSSIGESRESELSNDVEIDNNTKNIELKFHQITIEGYDPYGSVPRQRKNQQAIEPRRGIIRNVYVRYLLDGGGYAYEFVTAITEQEDKFTH